MTISPRQKTVVFNCNSPQAPEDKPSTWRKQVHGVSSLAAEPAWALPKICDESFVRVTNGLFMTELVRRKWQIIGRKSDFQKSDLWRSMRKQNNEEFLQMVWLTREQKLKAFANSFFEVSLIKNYQPGPEFRASFSGRIHGKKLPEIKLSFGKKNIANRHPQEKLLISKNQYYLGLA